MRYVLLAAAFHAVFTDVFWHPDGSESLGPRPGGAQNRACNLHESPDKLTSLAPICLGMLIPD